MTGTTTNYGFPYPQNTDLVTDGASAIQTLAEDVDTALFAAIPIGMITPYAGSSSPTGWLLCYGQEISRSTYAGLYAVVGDTYGSGDGSTTFNVPDLRGRTPAGLDNLGGSDAGRLSWANTLGTTGGTQTHTLTGAESGTSSHTHSINHDHASFNTASGGAHSHTGVNYTSATGGSLTGFVLAQHVATGAIINSTGSDHVHAIDVPSFSGTSGSSSTANASSAHNNMQPTILLSYIIKV